MNKKLKSLRPGHFLSLSLILMLAWSCTAKEDLSADLGKPEAANLGWGATPQPQKTGPFQVCEEVYEFQDQDSRYYVGKAYYPVLDSQSCRSDGIPKNLVILLHRRKSGSEYALYDDFAELLASNSIAVVSISWKVSGLDDFNAFPQTLNLHMDHIYNVLLPGQLTNDVALVGHSFGGKLAATYADEVNKYGKNLKAVVIMAGATNDIPVTTFQGVTDAFMGCIGFHDSDATTYGEKVSGKVMESVFRIYDEAGTWGPNGTSCRLTKDFLYSSGGHDLQDIPLYRAYIHAFLQQHLNGHNEYGRFFQQQERVPTFYGWELYQQHAENGARVLSNFDNDHKSINSDGGIIYHTSGISIDDVGEAHLLDDVYSPHHTLAMRFDWDPNGAGPGPHEVGFNFQFPEDLNDYRYLSFRIGQVHQSGYVGDKLDLRIHLKNSVGGSSSVLLSDKNGLIPYPPYLFSAVTGGQSRDKTKSHMQTYVIRLTDFHFDLKKIMGVSFDLSVNRGPRSSFLIDDVEFLK